MLTRSRRSRLAVAAVVSLLAGFAISTNSHAQGLTGDAAKAAAKCQKDIKKGAAKFVGSKIKILDKCSESIFKCIQTQADAAKRDTCVTKAGAKCTSTLAKIADAESSFSGAITGKCGTVSVADLKSTSGLGFDNVDFECSSSATLQDLANCVVEKHECRAEKLFMVEEPRAKELMAFAGVAPGTLSGLSCLDDLGGSGAHVSDAKAVGKPLDKCVKSGAKAASSFVTKRLKTLEKCLDAVFTCEQLKQNDLDACITKATGTCDKAFDAVTTALNKMLASVQKACGTLDFATALNAPEGANLGGLIDECTQYGVSSINSLADYLTCISNQHTCRSNEMLRYEAPRIAQLLQRVGRPATAVICPLPSPTATQTPIPTPTPTLTTTATPTLSATPTVTVTPTATLSATPTVTVTATATATATNVVTATHTVTPSPTSTPMATATANCGDNIKSADELCDPSAVSPGNVCPNSGNGLETCSMSCTCACPGKVDFEGNASDVASELDTGWTGVAHDAKVVSNGKVTVQVTGCQNASKPCGVCTISGPIANTHADNGDLNDRRCRNDSSIKCNTVGADPLCTGAGNACVFYFGAPLALSAGGVATCVTNEIVGTITGTANVETGESSSSLSLTSRVFNGILADKPCPTCSDTGALNDVVTTGTCNGGQRSGLACDANSQSPVPAFGRTSLDCPPLAAAVIATLPISLKNSTDTETRSLSAASPSCTANGFTGFKCMCDTCNDLAAEPCSLNTDCPAGGVCGGLRCLNDATTPGAACSTQGQGADAACGFGSCNLGTNVCNAGLHAGDPCFADTDCGGTCDHQGEPTKPNTCGNGVCSTGGGTDDGQCASPSDNLCSIETFRSCLNTAACRPASEGGTCSGCATGMQTCGLKKRECFFDLDNSPTPAAGTVTASGVESTPVNDTSTPTLASLFCIGPTSSSAVNSVAGLPGLGRLKLKGTARGLP